MPGRLDRGELDKILERADPGDRRDDRPRGEDRDGP
jgi:Zn-finger nucleic acid-binding protein